MAAGSNTKTVKVGDRVAIQPLVIDEDDFFSRRGLGQLSNLKGIVGLQWKGGGFAEYLQVPEQNVGVLPPEVSDLQGALTEPAAVAVHAVDRGGVGPGSSVLITGGGPIGALAALAAAAAGATTIIVSEPNRERREKLVSLGIASLVVDPNSGDAVDQIRKHSEADKGVDVAIECVGHELALSTCIEAVRPRGVIVQVGLTVKPGMVDISALVMKDITLEGSWCYPTTMWPRVIGLIASGKLPVEKVISEVITIEEAKDRGFDVLTGSGSDKLKIVVQPRH